MGAKDVRRRPPGRLRIIILLCVPAVLAGLTRAAGACDVCAVYTATEMGERRTGFRVGVAEQLSIFTTLQRDGEEVPNPADERITSSITQVVLGYNFHPRFGAQLNLPLIVRDFRRSEGGRIERGDESGPGDLSLLAHGLVASTVTERSLFRFSLLAGLKLPSGSTDRLAEELAETGGEAGGHEESGVHGHDLALGSGSVDGIFGGQIFWSWRRLFLTVGGQYALRTEGDFGYRYADDLTWVGGPGVFALLGHRHSLGVQALVSGETKGKDTLDDRRLDDTGITALYAGPGFTFTWGSSLAADIAADLPVVQNNTALQIVPDFRLRGGVTWRF